ncbi:MAG: tRNA 2-thiouridine(34) synthase MnmA [Minisyncoccota bacterium]
MDPKIVTGRPKKDMMKFIGKRIKKTSMVRILNKHTRTNTPQRKVFVGLSGGVDSSVSAALLKEQGHTVVGVFMKTWHPDFLPCAWKTERIDAMRVAAHLRVPFLTFDFEEEYRREVAEIMIREYKAGRTPNPDVLCNRAIKFGAFMKRARSLGADSIATGHYAEITTGTDGMSRLAVGADPQKDQSYFLWMLGQDDLLHTMFPVGSMQKNHVRALARKFKLPTAEKKDSQGVCFLGMLDMKEFLGHFIPPTPGAVLNTRGAVIGTHDGALFYTLGERHGFRIDKKTTHDTPYYVVAKDISKNTITVADKATYIHFGGTKTVTLRDSNWIGDFPRSGSHYVARGRYRGDLVACTVEQGSGGETSVAFNEPVSFAPGQSLVLYDGGVCMGGGVVE